MTYRGLEDGLPTGRGRNRPAELATLAHDLEEIAQSATFKMSARGWCYLLENKGVITKAEFDNCEKIINECRTQGILPVDFVAQDPTREFLLETPTEDAPIQMLYREIDGVLTLEEYYTPDWWEGEEYYLQLVVEKIDLRELFTPICQEYHVPIANARGWTSILQRADFAARFKQTEERGQKAVLLYCGDHDPAGLQMSEIMNDNLTDVKNVRWGDGRTGYDPKNLKIDRFGLNEDFIKANKLSTIPNLETGARGKIKDLADPRHPDHNKAYVQNYIKRFCSGRIDRVWKCEANALVVIPDQARDLCRRAIENYLGHDVRKRFQAKHQKIKDEFDRLRTRYQLDQFLKDAKDGMEADSEAEAGGYRNILRERWHRR